MNNDYSKKNRESEREFIKNIFRLNKTELDNLKDYKAKELWDVYLDLQKLWGKWCG